MRASIFLIGVVFLGVVLLFRFYFFYANAPIFKDTQRVIITTTLLSEPTVNGKTQRVTIHVQGQKIFVYTALFPRFSYGETLEIAGTIKKRVLDNGGVVLSVHFPKIVRKNENSLFVVKIAKQLREKIVGLYEQSLPPTGAGLLAGIVLGVKGGLPDDFETSFERVGLLHVIAASGMNVTIAGGALFFVATSFFKRKTAILFSFFGVLFYALMTGLESSIVRASLMAGIAGGAALVGRQQHSGISLILTGYCLLLYTPALYRDIGFQLSMLATAGIIFIKPRITPRSTEKGVRKVLTEDVTTTLAAQIATLPILLAVFGEYGLLSVPVNLLILWTVPFLMIIGGISAVVSLLVPFVAKVIVLTTLPFLLYIEAVVRFFGGFELLFSLQELPGVFVLSYYLLLVAILMRTKKPA